MAINMEIRRKSDNLLLTDVISNWTDWKPRYSAPVLDTVQMVPYPQPVGVMVKAVTVRAVFADHYAGSTDAKYWLLVAAHRKKWDLTFKDLRGNVTTVRVLEMAEPEHEDEVKTKSIRYQDITLYDPKWVA